MKSRAFAVALIALTGLAASCAANSYHAYEAGAGYSDERLSETNWRVSFTGSAVESQEVVEQQLLRRAAELTVQSGYDWFAPSAEGVQAEESVTVTGERPRLETGANVEPVWRPHWRRRSGSRWTDWDPQGATARAPAPAAPAPAMPDVHFAATSDITMGRAPAPAGAFDARAILAQAQ
jgi:hypothetical protein